LYHHWSRLPKGGTRPAPLRDAYLLMLRDQPEQAIEMLDSIDTRTLDPKTLTTWLNFKAFALALAGRSDEALDVLDDLQSLADANDAIMQLCLVGNRGVAHLYGGRLALAAQLLDDTEAAAQALAQTHPDYVPEALAETWWWRAEIARRQEDEPRRKACLQRAAEAGRSAYAVKAQLLLQKL
jgi:ATP/maltotriose-dependent transcriptional regulator MalT